MGSCTLEWKQIIHPAIDNRFIDLLLLFDEDDPDPYTVASVVEDVVTKEYVWVLKGGYPYGSSPTKEEAREDCKNCLIENYLDKGLMPWKSAFVSSN